MAYVDIHKYAESSKKEATTSQSKETSAVASPKNIFYGVKLNDGSNKMFVLNLIDSLHKPPVSIDEDYIKVINSAASILNLRYSDEVQKTSVSIIKNQAVNSERTDLSCKDNSFYTTNTLNSEERIRNDVNRRRNDIFKVMNNINSFISRAKNSGFIPKENPFLKLMSFNDGRQSFSAVNISNDEATQIITDINVYSQLIADEASGKININSKDFSQLSSATLSLSGFGGSADTSLSLSNFLLNIDDIKKQKADDALSVFDFSKRLPKILFTMEWAPNGVPRGIIVGWKKILDASGYIVKRTSLFDDSSIMYSFTNDEIKEDTDKLFDYVNSWVLSFYDNIDPKSIFFFIDTNVCTDRYYHYEVQAYQLQNILKTSLFDVDCSPAVLSRMQKVNIRNQLENLDPNPSQSSFRLLATTSSNFPDTISPYPVISHFLLGDSKYDWLLAALNVRQSINRGDDKATTRSFSYLTAQLDFIFSQIDAGKFLLPKNNNVNEMLKRISDAIGRYGVTQVIEDVLQESGALYYFDGKDPKDSSLFSNVDYTRKNSSQLSSVDNSSNSNSGLVALVATAIDPETATLDLKTLATNLPMLISGEFVNTKENLSGAALTSEVEVPSSKKSNSNIEFLSKLGALDDGVVDLMTADGIGTFMRTVRIISDLGSSKGYPIISTAKSVTPEQAK